MTAPRHRFRIMVVCGLVGAALLLPTAASAQNLPLPGEKIEENKPWTFWLSFPVLLGAGGLALLVGFSYLRLQRRFFGKEELPEEKLRRPQVLGAAAPRQMSAAPAPAASAAPAAPATEATAPKPAPPKPEATPTEKPSGEAQPEKPAEPEPEKPAEPEPEKPAEPEPEKPAEPAAEEKPAEPEPEKPAEPESTPDEGKPGPQVEVPAGLDAETFTRVLKEELDKGTARPVAEGRARAAAVRAARAKSGGS
jgi:outer membrane biosynthesis protein TonB